MGRAKNLFFGEAEQTLYKRISPTQEQRDFLQTQWNELADYLVKNLTQETGYAISTWIQGSYKFGTLIKPIHLGEKYDVDVGVYFEWPSEQKASPAPAQLRNWVQKSLETFALNKDEIESIESPPKERCSRANYYRQFHIDTPTYHLDSSRELRRLACLSGKWEASDPKKIYKWFRDSVDQSDRDQLRRLVRYLKAWAAVSFKDVPRARPTSILLTVLATEAFMSLWLERILDMDDDDALIEVVKKIYDRLFSNFEVKNPVDEKENLNRIAKEEQDHFFTRLRMLRDAAEKADQAIDEAVAAFAWSEVFSFLMPLPENQEIEIVDEGSNRAVMQLPEIEVDVYKRNPRSFIAKYKNEVPSVAKDCDLIFRIINPSIIPDFATVEWTVRNEGEEADSVGDLGHRRLGVGMFEVDEHTLYAGCQYMDVIIRASGQVYAVRRVPVTIRDVKYPARNPPRPAYTRLRSLIKRR